VGSPVLCGCEGDDDKEGLWVGPSEIEGSVGAKDK